MVELISFCCTSLSVWASLDFLDFNCLVGLGVLPCSLEFVCPQCVYFTPYSRVYRFPGCIAAFLQDLPWEVRETEDVNEVLSLLETEGERKLLLELLLRENHSAICRVISAYIGSSTPASSCYLREPEEFYIPSIDELFTGRTEERCPGKWWELSFSPVWTYISMRGLETLVKKIAPKACQVGLGAHNFALPFSEGLGSRTLREVVGGKETETVYVLKEAILRRKSLP